VGGDQKDGAPVTKSLFAIALGAGLLLAGSLGASAQEELFTSERDCTTDVQSLCAGVKPGSGRILACLQSHVGELSVGCSTILSKAAWTAKECASDIRQFCPGATFGSISDRLKPHLGEASDTCRSALAFVASSAADRY
jgi:hypothetical protein